MSDLQQPASGTKFEFHGGAGSYLGVSILSTLLTIFTVGIGFPWALVMVQRWKTENASVQGRRLKFKGSGLGLIGLWIKMLFLFIITFGIYGFWITPKLQKWIWQHTEIE
jgi:hypothetical protein